jgi:hypothetical protein
MVGTSADVADALQSWVEETGINGCNPGYALVPQIYADFVELVVPELQRRRVFRTKYQPGMLRARFQGSDRLRASHPDRAVA